MMIFISIDIQILFIQKHIWALKIFMKTNNEMIPNNNPTEVTFKCEWKSKFLLHSFITFL